MCTFSVPFRLLGGGSKHLSQVLALCQRSKLAGPISAGMLAVVPFFPVRARTMPGLRGDRQRRSNDSLSLRHSVPRRAPACRALPRPSRTIFYRRHNKSDCKSDPMKIKGARKSGMHGPFELSQQEDSLVVTTMTTIAAPRHNSAATGGQTGRRAAEATARDFHRPVHCLAVAA